MEPGVRRLSIILVGLVIYLIAGNISDDFIATFLGYSGIVVIIVGGCCLLRGPPTENGRVRNG